MTLYNLTNVTNSTNYASLFTTSNDLTGGWLGIFILMFCLAILFISMKNYSAKSAFAASSFITTILATLLRLINVVSEKALFLMILITAIAVVMLLADND